MNTFYWTQVINKRVSNKLLPVTMKRHDNMYFENVFFINTYIFTAHLANRVIL